MKEKQRHRPTPVQERDDVVVGLNRCPYCRDGVEPTESLVCQQCLTRHHADCWEEAGECSSCKSTVPLSPPAPKEWNLGELPEGTKLRVIEYTDDELQVEFDYFTRPQWWSQFLAGIVGLPFLFGIFPLLVALRFRALQPRLRIGPDKLEITRPRLLVSVFGALDFPWLETITIDRTAVEGVRVNSNSLAHWLEVDAEHQTHCLVGGTKGIPAPGISQEDNDCLRRVIEQWRDSR